MTFSRKTAVIALWLLLAQAALWGQKPPYKPPPPPPPPPVKIPSPANDNKYRPPLSAPRTLNPGASYGRTNASGNRVLVGGTTRMAPSSTVRKPQANRVQTTGVNNARIGQTNPTRGGALKVTIPKPTPVQQTATRTRLTSAKTKLAISRNGGIKGPGGPKPPSGGGGSGGKGGGGNSINPKSIKQAADLRMHLRLSEEYGQDGFKELRDGRIRYYGLLRPASTPGPMKGARSVKEWNPKTGRSRFWHETIDKQGRPRRIRPQKPAGEEKLHYDFDENGNYVRSDKK